jgi:hypothetical protein
MGQQWIVPPDANTIEPAIAPVVYSNGRSAVEWLGNGDVCFYLTQTQLPLEYGPGPPQSVVVARIIKPLADLPLVMVSISRCLEWHLCRHGPVCPARPPPLGSRPFRVVSS